VAVVVDATVRDAAGRHLPCLDASQFELLEDGKPQQISSFEAVDVPGCGAPAPDASSSATPPPLTRVLTTAPLVTALVFEELGDQARLAAWRAATAFVLEGRRTGEFIGVFAIDRTVHTMVRYTRDLDAVVAGLRKAVMRPGCPIESPGDVGSAAFSSLCRSGMSEDVRAGETLRGLQAVAGTLGHLPGRKNIVLFSEGFLVPPDGNAPEIFQRLTGGANRNTVTFHTIDAAGPRIGRPGGLGLDPTPFLEQLARDTGGQHVGGTNDLTAAVRQVTAEMRDYYRLTYSPTNPALDGGYRRLAVKVRVPGAVVSSRNGYQATPRPATAVVAPLDVAPHVLLDAVTLPRDFALGCETTLTSSAVTVVATVTGEVLSFQSDATTGAFEGGLTVLARVRGKDQRVIAASSDTFTLSGRQDQLPAAKGRLLRFNRQLPLEGAVTLEVIAYDVLGRRASAQRFKMKDLLRR